MSWAQIDRMASIITEAHERTGNDFATVCAWRVLFERMKGSSSHE